MNPLADDAIGAYLAGVAAADGTRLVKARVRTGALDDWLGDKYRPDRIPVLAIGKAAAPMLWGLVEANVPVGGIGIGPKGGKRPIIDTVRWHDGEHPIPGPGSERAAREVLEWARAFPHKRLLVLLSGGASSLMEAQDGPVDVAAWREDLRAGLDIEVLNARRAEHSLVKGGRLADAFARRGVDVRVWVLQDTPPGAVAAVGSGPFHDGHLPHHVLADAGVAVAAAGHALQQRGYSAYRFPGRIDGDLEGALTRFLDMAAGLDGGRVALVGAGEPQLALPGDAPPGGRCHHAALAAAQRLDAATFLAAGTDGIDGSTPDAGSWSDGATWAPAAADALRRFDAYAWLDARHRTIRTGPSGTNVNDLWVYLRAEAP